MMQVFGTDRVKYTIEPDADCPEYRIAYMTTKKGSYKLMEIQNSGIFWFQSRRADLGLILDLNKNEVLFGTFDATSSVIEMIEDEIAKQMIDNMKAFIQANS